MPAHFISVAEACRLLLEGKVIAVPTETVYGLAALATNVVAIEKIYRIKNRPADNPLICHFESFESALPYLSPFPSYVDVLQRCFSPGPMSYLLPLKDSSPLDAAVRGQRNVIVRIPAHPMLLDLLACVGKPLAAPSANTSGKYSATTAEMVYNDLGGKVDGIVDGGSAESGIESTIVDCTNADVIKILRPGSIGKRDIEEALSRHNLNVKVEYSEATQPTPGSIYKHYAPTTPLQKIESFKLIRENSCVLLSSELMLSAEKYFEHRTTNPFLLDIGSELHPETIAKNLYTTLAKLDSLNVTQAYIVYPKIVDPDWDRAIRYRLDKITGAT